MARNRIRIEAPSSSVWAVLEDPYAYPRWIVGADRTVDADPAWPAPGSAFRVRLPLGHVDSTTVEGLVPGLRLVLSAGASVVGPARVTIELKAEGATTEVTLIEDPAGKLAPLRFVPLVHLVTRVRNAESLRRLKRLVESASVVTA